MSYLWRPSPNFGPRRGGRKVDMLILHYTGMTSAERACAWLCNPQSQVSSHYLVEENGVVIAMVPEEMRAWHAGVSSWQGETDTNSRSIGIEIHNPGHGFGYPDFPEAQMRAVIALCHGIIERHRIAPSMVLAHSDVAPGRKIDPGEKFDWRRLAAEGIGLWMERPALAEVLLGAGDMGDEVSDWQCALASYGYDISPCEVFDEQTVKVTTAFQRHYRPETTNGFSNAASRATLDWLNKMKWASFNPH
jgi:N-acetylmuramoyl-L-alanine amidase